MISSDVIAEALQDGGTIALIRVERAEVRNAGTRGEQVNLSVSVLNQLGANIGTIAELTRYTSDRNTVLELNRVYIAVLSPSPRFAPRLFLSDFSSIGDKSPEQAFEVYQKIISELPF